MTPNTPSKTSNLSHEGRRTTTIHAVGVYGASGYTGQTLLRLLGTHPQVQVAFATSESSRETLDGMELMPLADAPLDTVRAVFLCLPHGVAGKVAAEAAAKGVKVIDLSADLRLDTPELYQQTYKHEHPAPHLLPAPYGLPELNRQAIMGAAYVANPGCHVTSVLLALAPLARLKALSPDPIIADTKTGISGAGRSPKLDSMFVEVYGDVRPYNAGRVHRHVPEIEQELHKLQPDCGPLVFVPHVVPVDVGLLATVYARLKPGWNMARIRAAFLADYEHEPLIDVLPEGKAAQIKHAAHKNNAVVGIGPLVGDTLVITCAIDNLRKGAASQAVQNFNLMMGVPETVGLV
ncbi:N-acetyl-gamma-glutamyl-phosphate reductase [Anaerolineae bacterium]|nr:N-acetyl-gamma-glutamyl-phosphate reductase [Anaerolineae bacterium]